MFGDVSIYAKPNGPIINSVCQKCLPQDPLLTIFSVLCLPSSMEIYLASVYSSSCHEIKDWFYFEWAVNICAVDGACLGSEMI